MKKIFAILFATFAMVGLAQAGAGHSPTYVTGAVTSNDLDNNPGMHIDKTTGWTLGAGHDIYGKKWLAVEGTYGQSGELKGSAPHYGNVEGEIKTIGVWIVADPTIFKINHMPVKAIARVGGVYNNVNLHGQPNFYDTGLAYGAGIGLGITKKIDVILDYRVMDIDIVPGQDLDVKAVGISLNYSF